MRPGARSWNGASARVARWPSCPGLPPAERRGEPRARPIPCSAFPRKLRRSRLLATRCPALAATALGGFATGCPSSCMRPIRTPFRKPSGTRLTRRRPDVISIWWATGVSRCWWPTTVRWVSSTKVRACDGWCTPVRRGAPGSPRSLRRRGSRCGGRLLRSARRVRRRSGSSARLTSRCWHSMTGCRSSGLCCVRRETRGGCWCGCASLCRSELGQDGWSIARSGGCDRAFSRCGRKTRCATSKRPQFATTSRRETARSSLVRTSPRRAPPSAARQSSGSRRSARPPRP